MYKKLVKHGLSSDQKVYMLKFIAHVVHKVKVPISTELAKMFGKRFLEQSFLRYYYPYEWRLRNEDIDASRDAVVEEIY